MKKLIVLSLTLVVAHSIRAQDNPVRIGLKLGVPNLVGLHLEYVTPLLDGKLAPSVDLTYLPLSFVDPDVVGTTNVKSKFSYFEAGVNYYFFQPGRNLYGNLSFGRLGLDYNFTDYESDETNRSGGVGELKMSAGLLNIKIGAKLGRGFYFRPEIGVALISTSSDNVEYTITYPDGTTETESEELPDVLLGVMPVINLGFGVSF